MSEKIWSDDAWNDYLYWQMQDKKTLKRINQLLRDIERNGCMEGIGKPEPLTGCLRGEFSRRINDITTAAKYRKILLAQISICCVGFSSRSHRYAVENPPCI